MNTASVLCVLMTLLQVGQDKPFSIIDERGPEYVSRDSDRIDLKKLPIEKLSQLNFLFGGVGDGKSALPGSAAWRALMPIPARHVCSSIIGMNRAIKQLRGARRTQTRVHMTLLDLHPMALARDLCMFFLLDDLTQQDHEEETRAEIIATIFYHFTGIACPAYCHDR